MVTRSLYFLPTWQNAYRGFDHFDYTRAATFPHRFRCGHNAVCINEDLIIWGGYNQPEFENATYCEIDALAVYNLDFDKWFSVKTSGKSPLYRSGAMSVLVWPLWYIMGGHTYTGDVNDVHTLNLITLEWQLVETTGKETFSKRDKASAWVWHNRIYCFGGYGPNPYEDLWDPDEDVFIKELLTDRGWNNQLLYLDLKENRWVLPKCEGFKPEARAAHSSTLVGNYIFVFGGRHKSERLQDLHRLDLHSHTWSGRIPCLGEIPCGRSWHSMTKIHNSRLLLFGGFSNDNVPLDDAWLLNIETYSWSVLSRKTGLPRLWHSACTNSYGDVLVFGGCKTNIINERIPLVTSERVLLFRTEPFQLQRLCLHVLYKHRELTDQYWDQLPKDIHDWLLTRVKFYYPLGPDYYENNAEVAHGPSLDSLSVLTKEEAERLNELYKDPDEV